MSARLHTLLAIAAVAATASVLLQLGQAQASVCTRWVAPPPAGKDSNPGTEAMPWATLEHASLQLPDEPCTVWVKDGQYVGENNLERRFTSVVTFKAVHPYRAVFENSGPALELDGARNMVFEGFEFRHSGPGAGKHVVIADRREDLWLENITFRNNIFHDSYNNDLLKVHNSSRFITIENNVFYNQGNDEQHIDANSVTDVVIQDNIFFNDFAGSGRKGSGDTKHFIVVKDSNEGADGLDGSERVQIRRNIFLNWEGGVHTFVQIGNDGNPNHEAKDVLVENNLMIGNALNLSSAAFGVRGARDVTFANNTVVGDLPALAYALRLTITGLNPPNENIAFYNNVWSDPTGTMGSNLEGSANEFSDGDPAENINLVLHNNLYWNGGAAIPPGEVVSPLVDDAQAITADPLLATDHSGLVLPRWNGSTFVSGNRLIRQEFERLVRAYGRMAIGSPVIGRAEPAHAPADDILGRKRSPTPDLGAYEYEFRLAGSSELNAVSLLWSDPGEELATSLAISYTVGTTTQTIADIPISTRAYEVTGLMPYSLYTFVVTARDDSDSVLVQSEALLLLTTDKHAYIASIRRNASSQ